MIATELLLVLLVFLIATPKAWAQDAEDQCVNKCVEKYPEGVVLTCPESCTLNRAAKKGQKYEEQRDIANDAEAKTNMLGGKVDELRKRNRQLAGDVLNQAKENARLTVQLEERASPFRWLTFGACGGGLAFSGGLALFGRDTEAMVGAATSLAFCAGAFFID